MLLVFIAPLLDAPALIVLFFLWKSFGASAVALPPEEGLTSNQDNTTPALSFPLEFRLCDGAATNPRLLTPPRPPAGLRGTEHSSATYGTRGTGDGAPVAMAMAMRENTVFFGGLGSNNLLLRMRQSPEKGERPGPCWSLGASTALELLRANAERGT